MARHVKIPGYELLFSFARAGGPGGQNVNKVETKVTVLFYFSHSGALTPIEKAMLASNPIIKRYLNTDGAIAMSSQVHRSQARNREEAVAALHKLIAKALERKRPRIPTSKTASSNRKRLDSKKHRSTAKASRQRIQRGDD
jgi:ribosome-associated protein